MYAFNFEKLEAWNKSRHLTKKIYQTTKSFPNDEKYGIIGQIRRAVISVCSNLAEGSSRRTRKDQYHFYNIAFSSLMETLNQLIICNDLEYLDNNILKEFRGDIHTISLMINNLTKYTREKSKE